MIFQIRSSESQRQQDKGTENHSIEIWHTLITVHWYKQQRNASWNNWINKSINRAGRHPRWRGTLAGWHSGTLAALFTKPRACSAKATLRRSPPRPPRVLGITASPHHRITARPSFPRPPFPHKLRSPLSAFRSRRTTGQTCGQPSGQLSGQPASYLAIQPAIQLNIQPIKKTWPNETGFGCAASQLLSRLTSHLYFALLCFNLYR